MIKPDTGGPGYGYRERVGRRDDDNNNNNRLSPEPHKKKKKITYSFTRLKQHYGMYVYTV